MPVLEASASNKLKEEKMLKFIRNEGYFVYLISGLASGDPEFIQSYIQGEYDLGLKEIIWDLEVFERTAMASKAKNSRWYIAQHPHLGRLSWLLSKKNTEIIEFQLAVQGRTVVHLMRDEFKHLGWGVILTDSLWYARYFLVPRDEYREVTNRLIRHMK